MKKNDNGFTLIEVALVLAIAGAIFAAVFIALRGIWADERDSERRDDVMTFIRQLKNYQSNNSRRALPTVPSGKYPHYIDGEDIAADRQATSKKYTDDTSWEVFYRDYFKDAFTDPDGLLYNINIRECDAKNVNLEQSCGLDVTGNYTIDVVIGAVCYGEDAIRSANTRNVAVLYDMEAGGYYCENT